MKKGKKAFWTVVVAVVVVLAILLSLNHFYVDYLWFSEMGYLNVFFKELVTKVQIGTPVFVVLLVLLFFYLKFLKKISERYLGITQAVRTKREKTIGAVLSVVAAAVITGFIANSLWSEILQFTNATDFGTTDPLFGKDLSFYFFTLPLLKGAYGVVMTCFFGMVILTLLYTVFVMYREKDFRIQTAQSMDDFKSGAKDIFTTFLTLASKQIGVFLGIFFLLLAFSSFIGRYEMLYGGTGMVYGAGASDITIGMKVLYVKIALCLVLAVTSVLAGFRKNYKMMAAGPAGRRGTGSLRIPVGGAKPVYQGSTLH